MCTDLFRWVLAKGWHSAHLTVHSCKQSSFSDSPHGRETGTSMVTVTHLGFLTQVMALFQQCLLSKTPWVSSVCGLQDCLGSVLGVVLCGLWQGNGAVLGVWKVKNEWKKMSGFKKQQSLLSAFSLLHLSLALWEQGYIVEKAKPCGRSNMMRNVEPVEKSECWGGAVALSEQSPRGQGHAELSHRAVWGLCTARCHRRCPQGRGHWAPQLLPGSLPGLWLSAPGYGITLGVLAGLQWIGSWERGLKCSYIQTKCFVNFKC